jgi:predicted metal-dependent hydrolase
VGIHASCRIERERQRAEISRRETVERTAEELRELRRRAVRELPLRLHALAEMHALTVASVHIRNQKSRWGSCSPAGRICLNWRLVLMPDFVRDYVIVHELMHLRRLDHSRAFWKLVAAADPGYESARAWLRQNKHLLY